MKVGPENGPKICLFYLPTFMVQLFLICHSFNSSKVQKKDQRLDLKTLVVMKMKGNVQIVHAMCVVRF